MNLRQERETLIKKFNDLEKKTKDSKKDIINKLCINLDKSLQEKSAEVLTQFKLVNKEPDKKNIIEVIKRIRDKNNWSISDRWIYENTPKPFKSETKPESEPSKIVRLTDNYLWEHKDELIERIKDMNKGPAKDIKVKEKIDDLEKYTWKCWFAQELVKLAINMEKEHEETHDASLCAEYSKRAKSVRDRRFATSINQYEAIILNTHASTSLKNAIAGEWEFLDWREVLDNMKNCRECLGLQDCLRRHCKCVCHRVVKPMTTKGLKYAINTNDYLKNWDKQMSELTRLDNDICRIGKTLLENKETKLTKAEKERLMNNHISRHDCIQCELFLEKNPDFFKEDN